MALIVFLTTKLALPCIKSWRKISKYLSIWSMVKCFGNWHKIVSHVAAQSGANSRAPSLEQILTVLPLLSCRLFENRAQLAIRVSHKELLWDVVSLKLTRSSAWIDDGRALSGVLQHHRPNAASPKLHGAAFEGGAGRGTGGLLQEPLWWHVWGVQLHNWDSRHWHQCKVSSDKWLHWDNQSRKVWLLLVRDQSGGE